MGFSYRNNTRYAQILNIGKPRLKAYNSCGDSTDPLDAASSYDVEAPVEVHLRQPLVETLERQQQQEARRGQVGGELGEHARRGRRDQAVIEKLLHRAQVHRAPVPSAVEAGAADPTAESFGLHLVCRPRFKCCCCCC